VKETLEFASFILQTNAIGCVPRPCHSNIALSAQMLGSCGETVERTARMSENRPRFMVISGKRSSAGAANAPPSAIVKTLANRGQTVLTTGNAVRAARLKFEPIVTSARLVRVCTPPTPVGGTMDADTPFTTLSCACLLFACSNARPPPPPGPVLMSITVPEDCYHAQLKEGGDLCAGGSSPDAGDAPKSPVVTFRLVALTTPQRTDGALEVVVSSLSDAFPDQKLAPIAKTLERSPPTDVSFDFALPDGTGTCGLFALSLRARAGKNQYAGIITSSCQ
jgi:hypothetical protein